MSKWSDLVATTPNLASMRLSFRLTPGWRHKVFVSYVAVMLVAFLLPVPSAPLAESRYADKLAHFGIFLGFALLFYIDRHEKAWWTFLISVAFAAGIELVQWAVPYREGDCLDFVAGAAGAGVGTVLLVFIARQQRRVAAR
jgi:VanZ family protein